MAIMKSNLSLQLYSAIWVYMILCVSRHKVNVCSSTAVIENNWKHDRKHKNDKNIDYNPKKTKLENAVTIEMAINATEKGM